MTFEKGVLDKAANKVKVDNTKTKFPSMGDRDKAKETFEFVAGNSDVEWLSVTTGQEGSKQTQTRISTSHLTDQVHSPVGDLLDAASTSDLKILEIAHSHPIAEANYPSGFNPRGEVDTSQNRGDRVAAERVEKSYRKNIVNFNIYVGPTGSTVFYNSKKIHR